MFEGEPTRKMKNYILKRAHAPNDDMTATTSKPKTKMCDWMSASVVIQSYSSLR